MNETGDAVQDAGQALDDTVKTVTGEGPAADAVDGATDAAGAVVGGATEGAKNVTDGVTDTLGGITGG